MNIIVLTADEPLYLPTFFHEFLQERVGDIRAIYVVPPRYGQDSSFRMACKYLSAFGLANFVRLVVRTVWAKFCERTGLGRSRGRFYSVYSAAAARGVPCELVPDVNAPEFRKRLSDMGTDLIVSVSCPQLFRKPLIELPPRGCLNVHGALLPQYRGIAPSFWMMVNGETRAGVTVFLVNEDIDAGEVVEVEEFDIDPHETLHEFIIRSKRIACHVLLRAIARVEQGSPQTTPLRKDAGSYFGFPTRTAYSEFRRRGRSLW